MTTLREAAQQALEALEYHVEQTRSIWKTSQAIDALRAALAQQTQTPCDIAEDGVCEVIDCCRNRSQEEQEPVLVVEQEPDYMSCGHFYEGSKPFIDPTEVWKLPIGTKLYTAPPRREWQGLTDTDIARVFRAVYGGVRFGPSEKEFAIAVESLIKEKNHG
jgi:hypothetical protein